MHSLLWTNHINLNFTRTIQLQFQINIFFFFLKNIPNQTIRTTKTEMEIINIIILAQIPSTRRGSGGGLWNEAVMQIVLPALKK